MIILIGLRKEIESHRFLCNEKDRQNSECEAEICRTRDNIRQVESDIYKTTNDLTEKGHTGNVLKSQLEAANIELNREREERMRD